MILDEIIEKTKVEVERRKSAVPLAELREKCGSAPRARGFAQALKARRSRTQGDGQARALDSLACIAEFKRRSPSAGWIRQGASAVDITSRYRLAGADALSVLTDEPFFGGTLDDLRAVRAAVDLPVLRKDFIVDTYQLFEARAAGADAALLIVSALTDDDLRDLMAEGDPLGLDVLVEVHDESEVRRAIDLGARLVGINHRNLRDFTVDTTLAVRMRERLSPDVFVVAESGLGSTADLQRMVDGGIDAVLVGERLMRAEDPGEALRTLYSVGPGLR